MKIPSKPGTRRTASKDGVEITLSRLSNRIRCVIRSDGEEVSFESAFLSGTGDLLEQFMRDKPRGFRGLKYRAVLSLLSTGVVDGIS